MALDAQSNWNVEMSKPFQLALHPTKHAEPSSSTTSPLTATSRSAPEILLPPEMIAQIISYLPHRPSTQGTFWACTLVSRAWYAASIEILYDRPFLTGGNFSQFVTTVCPSKNAHIRKSALSVLVKRLDMGDLVHNASKSLTARLLGRLKGNIEGFVAPQASFAINSFAALSKCTKLRHLDLSLISASISNKLLFQTLKSLTELETLFFPRSSGLDQQADTEPYSWPPKLQALHLAGGISDNFLCTHLSNVSASLSRLSIQSCTQVHVSSLLSVMEKIGGRLKHLTIRHPMPQLFHGALDSLLLDLPGLTALRISADYISNSFFSAESIPRNHPLRILDLECSATAAADVGIDASAIYDAVERDQLPDLRSVRVSMRLAWAATEATRLDASDLLEIIEEKDAEKPLDVLANVHAFELPFNTSSLRANQPEVGLIFNCGVFGLIHGDLTLNHILLRPDFLPANPSSPFISRLGLDTEFTHSLLDWVADLEQPGGVKIIPLVDSTKSHFISIPLFTEGNWK